jgi:4-amino-4-deoxy-L-arabinose transferase-like glycosyltransferase
MKARVANGPAAGLEPPQAFASAASTPRAAAWSRIDTAVCAALGLLTVAVSFYFAPRGFHLGFVDMGHDGYQMRQVLDLAGGGVIFRDTFDQYGPLTGYLNTAGFLLLGRRLLAIKFFLGLWYGAIAVLLYVMARRWLGAAMAAFSIAVWLGLAPFYQHGIMISAHVYVLFFQTIATFVALRAERLEPGAFAVVGVLAGLSAACKSSMGAAYLAAVVLYVLVRMILDRDVRRRGAAAAIAAFAGFASVLAAAAIWLWAHGAVHDWYLQTVAFPRQFYLDYAQPPGGGNPSLLARLVPRTLSNFAQVQSEQAPYWWIIRIAIVVAALVQIARRRIDRDLLLMACITGLLWAGVFASLNFMHQWWTISLSVPTLVVCMRLLAAGYVDDTRLQSVAAVALVVVLVGPGLLERKAAAAVRTATLTDTIQEPPRYRGIRTDAPTRRAFETLSEVITRYRTHHPGTAIVTTDASDGWWTGINESLPFLTFFDNRHPHPVYWALPVLSTAIYPEYGHVLEHQIETEHPLVIEQHAGWYRPRAPRGYALIASAQNDGGNWYLYAAEHADRAQHGEVSVYVARDGRIESGFAERDAVPLLAMRLSSGTEAAFRGRVRLTDRAHDVVKVPGTFPVEVHDAALTNARGPLDVYTWPPDMRLAAPGGAFTPTPTNPLLRADSVREFAAGRWRVDGDSPGPYTYLLQFGDAAVTAGTYFVVRGELETGGFTVGFLQDDRWVNYANVTQPGTFEVVMQAPADGRYRLIVANCLETGWLQTGWRYRLRQRLGLGRIGPNRFHVTQAGWFAPPAQMPPDPWLDLSADPLK